MFGREKIRVEVVYRLKITNEELSLHAKLINVKQL